jgi:hypothetical protein
MMHGFWYQNVDILIPNISVYQTQFSDLIWISYEFYKFNLFSENRKLQNSNLDFWKLWKDLK